MMEGRLIKGIYNGGRGVDYFDWECCRRGGGGILFVFYGGVVDRWWTGQWAGIIVIRCPARGCYQTVDAEKGHQLSRKSKCWQEDRCQM